MRGWRAKEVRRWCRDGVFWRHRRKSKRWCCGADFGKLECMCEGMEVHERKVDEGEIKTENMLQVVQVCAPTVDSAEEL